jgi:hypothetical protein
MKRDVAPKYEYGVNIEFPIFHWKTCCSCKKEFRREKGYSFVAGPFCGGIGRRRYVCTTCCPTIDDVHAYAISGKWMPSRPTPPYIDIKG